MRKAILVSFIILFIFIVTACANTRDVVTEPARQPTLGFEETEMSLNVGDIVSLSLTPGDAGHELTFESSDDSVAKVTQDGTVTAIAAGNAVITAHMNSTVAYLKITVTAPKTIILEEFANELLELTNNERNAFGLDPLEHDENLDKAASIRVLEISEHFAHTRPDGSSFATAFYEAEVTSGRWGENLGSCQNTPGEVIEDWLDSESHREAMLNPDYLYMGVGIFIDPEGNIFWVQAFRG